MASVDSLSSGQNNGVPYDYGTSDKKSDSGKAPKFNGDPEEFSWWKTNMYSYIMGLEGAAIDRNKHTHAQKKLYKKHHKMREILVASIPRT